MNNRGVMAKKKKTPVAQIEPISLPDEDLAKARAWLEGLNADIAYSQAKRQLAEACGWERSKSNAVIVALHEEGFMAGEKNYFCNPNAPAEPGVVRGAREVSNFTIMLQSDPEVSVPLPYAIHCLPGDVFMLRKTVTGNWRVSNFVARHQTRWVCKLRGRIRRGRRSGIAQVVPINGFAPVEMQMDLADVPAEVDLEKAAFEVEFLPESMKPEPYVEIFVRFVKEIGNRFDPLGEIAIASAEYDLPVEFSAAALDEAQALPDEVDPKNIGRRVDLRDIPFVTIDGEDARDFDDAVYCARVEDGRTRLLVAIADVSHYVKPGAPLDVAAQQRATSVYFPASVVPMLPEKLSNGLCSLNPGVDRLTMVCDAVIDPEGRTEAYQFYPAVIHSHARLTYTQVWGALQGEEGGLAAVGDRLDDIRALYELFKTLRKARDARHTLDLETKETMAVFDDKGVISEFNAEFREKHNLPQPAIRLEKRTWYNPNYNMRFFMIPALLAVLAMLDTMMMSSLSIAREREEGTFDQLLVAPYRPSEIIAAKAATYVIVGLVQMTMIFLISLFWYRIPFHGSIALLYLGLVTFILAAVGAGLCISALSNTMQQAMMGMFLTAMPFTLLSGLATPIDSMNDFFQYLTMLNPMRYGIVIIHRIYLEGAGFLLLWRFFLYMFLIAAVTLCAANAIFKKQLHG